MIKDNGMPNKSWEEAIYIVVYLQNKSITKTIPYMTPLKAWSGHKPSVRHVNLFRCICYISL